MDAPTASRVCPFLRSCKEECQEPLHGEQTGEVPKWLKGCLIRVGSGLLEIGPDKYNHVFDGMALMHRFAFREGSVTYQNRFLRSDSYRRNMKANRIVVSEFGTRGVPDPCKTIFQRFASLFSLDDMTDNDLVNIVLYCDESYACTETNNIWRIDPNTLDSLQKVNLTKFVAVNGATAHAHEDTDGTIYNVGSSYGLRPSYSIIKFPPKEDKNSSPFQNGSVVCRIPSSKFLNLSYHHSFGMTENYFVFVEQPLYMSIPRLAWVHFVTGTYSEAMHWDESSPARFYVVRRSDGHLLDTVYLAKSFFVFHHINAYEEASHLVLDMCCYEHGNVVNALYVKALEDAFSDPHKKVTTEPFQSEAKRYVLPLALFEESEDQNTNLVTLPTTKATAYRLPDGSILCTPELLTGSEPWAPELPRIHYEKYNGKKYRYFYAMAKNKKLEGPHLLKIDTETKTTKYWNEEGAIPSEPVFLADPDPSDRDEDSGVLLASLLYTEDERKVSLLVLDAKTMTEKARATFSPPGSVPGDFHGVYYPTERISS